MSKDSEKLFNFVTGVTGDHFLRVEKEIGRGYYRLSVAEAERRQARNDIRRVEDVLVELVRNSRDAGAKKIWIASGKDAGGLRQITAIDDGGGVPRELHETIFEPRITSKLEKLTEDRYGLHGRGMALYSIKSNSEYAGLVSSDPGRCTAVKVVIDTKRIPERKDQSALPRIDLAGKRARVRSGPKNMWRILFELNIESPEVEIFFGKDADILASMVEFGPIDIDEFSPSSLSDFARSELGMKISLRNCQRISAGHIGPAPSVKKLLARIESAKSTLTVGRKSSVSLIGGQDKKEFSQGIERSFRILEEKYFIRLDGEPKIDFSKTNIKIDLPISFEDSW